MFIYCWNYILWSGGSVYSHFTLTPGNLRVILSCIRARLSASLRASLKLPNHFENGVKCPDWSPLAESIRHLVARAQCQCLASHNLTRPRVAIIAAFCKFSSNIKFDISQDTIYCANYPFSVLDF